MRALLGYAGAVTDSLRGGEGGRQMPKPNRPQAHIHEEQAAFSDLNRCAAGPLFLIHYLIMHHKQLALLQRHILAAQLNAELETSMQEGQTETKMGDLLWCVCGTEARSMRVAWASHNLQGICHMQCKHLDGAVALLGCPGPRSL